MTTMTATFARIREHKLRHGDLYATHPSATYVMEWQDPKHVGSARTDWVLRVTPDFDPKLDTFRALDAWIGTRQPTKRWASNLVLVRLAGGSIAVRLHQTDVVTHHPDRTMTLRTGGWHTQETTKRIREFMPLGWNLHTGHPWEITGPMVDFAFTEGIRIHLATEEVVDPGNPQAVVHSWPKKFHRADGYGQNRERDPWGRQQPGGWWGG